MQHLLRPFLRLCLQVKAKKVSESQAKESWILLSARVKQSQRLVNLKMALTEAFVKLTLNSNVNSVEDKSKGRIGNLYHSHNICRLCKHLSSHHSAYQIRTARMTYTHRNRTYQLICPNNVLKSPDKRK